MSQDPCVDAAVSRRLFLQSATGAAAVAGGLMSGRAARAAGSKPAILGGAPVHSGEWPDWPVSDDLEADSLLKVLKSGAWYRYRAGNDGMVADFERQWAAEVGTPHCQATSSGTTALACALAALDVGPGDEVLVPPYTFIATINAVLAHHALPVFVDSDPATALMDPDKIEDRVNGSTRAILPVHIAGAPCDMDRILSIANRRGLKVIEDACQAHTAAWRDRRVGSLGDAGCFSFQNSKNSTSGEGGALTTSDPGLFAQARIFQNNGNGPGSDAGPRTSNGLNLRMTEFQGALLLAQLTRNEEFARRREERAALLSRRLDEIPGVRAKATYPGTTRHGYHIYMFEYDPDQFAGMSKSQFLRALRAEGVPASGGYRALNRQAFVEQFLASRGFLRIYSKRRLDDYREQNHCPANDRLIETTCWLMQNILLGTPADIEAIAEAVDRIQKHAGEVASAA